MTATTTATVEVTATPVATALPLTARAMRRIEQGKKNQSELARALGLHQSHVCLIFAGKRKPSLDVAAGLAARLRVSLDEFYAYLLVRAPQPQTLIVN
jgi:transcriptional regulator with XRE-family HTH domain